MSIFNYKNTKTLIFSEAAKAASGSSTGVLATETCSHLISFYGCHDVLDVKQRPLCAEVFTEGLTLQQTHAELQWEGVSLTHRLPDQ